jgi:hypothetical protein
MDLDPRREAPSRRLNPWLSTIVSQGRSFAPPPSFGSALHLPPPTARFARSYQPDFLTRFSVNCDTFRRIIFTHWRPGPLSRSFCIDNCGLFSLSCGLGLLCSQT